MGIILETLSIETVNNLEFNFIQLLIAAVEFH